MRQVLDVLGVASPALWWSLLYFFCLLTGYYVLRPVRDAMGASGDVAAVFPPALVDWAQRAGIDLGAFTLQLLFTATFVCMVLLQPVYGALVSRYPRRVFLPAVYLFFIACLGFFHWAFDRALPGRGAAFFVWVAVFNLFAVSVFWSYMADVFDNENAKKVYGYIGAGGTLGALLGPSITRLLAERIGVGNLLLVSAGFLGVCLLCILMLRPWAIARERAHHERSGEEAMGGSVLAGLRLVWQDPLLRAMALLMFFGVGVGTLLYNEQAAIARKLLDDATRTAYYARLDLAVNLLTILIQVFLTRWLLRRFGIAPLLLVPASAILLGFALLAASPLPMLIWVVQVMTRACEFSLAKPARETIYTRVDREARYKAKAVIDTMVYRGSDLSFVWLHKALAAFGSSVVFLAGVGVALCMTASAWAVVRAQRGLPETAPAGEPQPVAGRG
ncbi:membrane protein [Pseudoxanthomonas suwonensis]|uniref:Membrane protein n=1 Tax=Pseudoxanthomonas suwonensis TaxID=314722 RepID=A0A0E3UPM7_9GAMM|nr:membrane protein [Pseudoxanthomonas suwonensis]